MTSRRQTLGPAERAVFTMVELSGGFPRTLAPLYKRQLDALVRLGMLTPPNGDDMYHVTPGLSSTMPSASHGSQPPPAHPVIPAPPRVPTIHPPASEPPAPPTPVPAHEPMGTLVARVPQEWIDYIWTLDPKNRSNGLRTLLEPIMKRRLQGSGARRRAS
jgi:hypothetical protein